VLLVGSKVDCVLKHLRKLGVVSTCLHQYVFSLPYHFCPNSKPFLLLFLIVKVNEYIRLSCNMLQKS
jgi:hypothetical protein